MELWKDWYLLERENRNRDGEWLEIAQRKAARAEGKPVSKMTAEQWQRLYGPPIPHKGNIRPPAIHADAGGPRRSPAMG